MAPEVIKKGVQYTFTADWFSLGCVLYKLLKGHSPFRSSNARSKEEIDQQTLTKEVQMSSSFSPELSELLSGLLQKDPGQRTGCHGRGSEEVKESAFFAHTNWDNVLAKKLKPPLIPPRGEVNAADAFDIGSFDEDDTKKIKLSEADQKVYKSFNLLVPDRWQAEMMEGVFGSVNSEKDKQEEREKQKCQRAGVDQKK
jgi:beta-adrenergic-receptor kinase